MTTGKQLSCDVCAQEFPSRSALFLHIRNSGCLSTDDDNESVNYTMERNHVAISLGYDAYTVVPVPTTRDEQDSCDAQKIERLIRDAFTHALSTTFADVIKSGLGVTPSEMQRLVPEIMTISQSSTTKVRHSSLREENGIGSTGTVITLSYTFPVRRSFLERNKKFQRQEKERILEIIIKACQSYLDQDQVIHHQSFISVVSQVKILAARNLATNLCAEMDCTQRVYHFLLPLNWLTGGKEVGKWWLEELKIQRKSTQNVFHDGHGIEGLARSKVQAPNDIMRCLKDSLRSAESKDRSGRTAKEGETLANGRFGRLAYKAKRAFHNFADPRLEGNASPSHKPIWRVLDKVKNLQKIPFTDKSGETQVILVIMFSGDNFLPQQVRRIMGAAIAISNGWLPENFIDLACSPDILIETPLAPANCMYFAEAKYHFFALSNGHELFGGQETMVEGFVDRINRRILERMTTPDVVSQHASWLLNLEINVAPRIRKQLVHGRLQIKNEESSYSTKNTDLFSVHREEEVPKEYGGCLRILRSIVSSKQWPTTSTARSKVIARNKDNDLDYIKVGSFSIINPKYRDRNGIEILKNENVKTPLGNTLFPDLVKEVFELEQKISWGTQRPVSSHCAVNSNALFTPHVDSGRGLGQSLSMIVGLGDYKGGDLFVEGKAHNIRYKPFEFDGWRYRHWTAPFIGERFSLVWFTPEMEK